MGEILKGDLQDAPAVVPYRVVLGVPREQLGRGAECLSREVVARNLDVSI